MASKFGKMSLRKVVRELQLLNKKARVVMNSNNDGIVTDCPVKKLHMPQDFYVTRNGNISNLGHTESGDYLLIHVEVKETQVSKKPKLSRLNQVFDKMFALKGQAQTNNRQM